jgi:hypothetical protein
MGWGLKKGRVGGGERERNTCSTNEFSVGSKKAVLIE